MQKIYKCYILLYMMGVLNEDLSIKVEYKKTEAYDGYYVYMRRTAIRTDRQTDRPAHTYSFHSLPASFNYVQLVWQPCLYTAMYSLPHLFRNFSQLVEGQTISK